MCFIGSTFIRDGEGRRQAERRCACSDSRVGGDCALHHTPSKDPIIQSSKGSRTARAGANGTYKVFKIFGESSNAALGKEGREISLITHTKL